MKELRGKKIRSWFRDLRSILVKDLKSTKRVKKYFFSSILPPLVLFIVFSLFTATGTPETYKVMLVDADNSQYSNTMDNYITNISSNFGPWFSVEKVQTYNEAMQKLNDFQVLGLIYIAPGFGYNISSGVSNGTLQLKIQNINSDYVKNFVQRLDEAVLAFNQNVHTANESLGNFSITAQKSYLIGTTGTAVSSFRGLTIGVVGLYGMIFGLLMGSLNIAKEYEDNTMLEIINSPIRKTAFIASKQLVGVFLGLISTLIIGLILYLVTGIQFMGNIWDFLVIIFAFCLSTWTHANIGTLIGWKFKKVMPVILISIVSSMFLWFFTGGLSPTIMLGNLVYNVSRIFPGTYWMEILFNATFIPNASYILIRLGILAIFSVAVTVISWTIISKGGFKL